MHLVIFGLTISSSWGNGHATIWRGLLKAFAARGHTVTFYEKDVPYYANARDGWSPPCGSNLRLYGSFSSIREEARRDMDGADLALCTSYCPDGIEASHLILESRAGLRAFYDLDTPVTLAAMRVGKSVPYLPPEGLGEFDLALSYTGGKALDELRSRLGARVVAPLYGAVDPETHAPTQPMDEFRSALSHLGTYAPDRQDCLNELFVKPALHSPHLRFVLGGAQYPDDFPWTQNIFFVRHLPPMLHPAFYCSSRATLNVTRRAMADYGYCPSGRLFEAAACGVPILTDVWDGLEEFFSPGREILPVGTCDDVLSALSLSDSELARVGTAARARTLENHTAERRVAALESICEQVMGGGSQFALSA